jgi:hypothetical protein
VLLSCSTKVEHGLDKLGLTELKFERILFYQQNLVPDNYRNGVTTPHFREEPKLKVDNLPAYQHLHHLWQGS